MTATDELEKVVRRDHADPHHFLGAHPNGGKEVVVRAFRPAAGVFPVTFFCNFMLSSLLPTRAAAHPGTFSVTGLRGNRKAKRVTLQKSGAWKRMLLRDAGRGYTN